MPAAEPRTDLRTDQRTAEALHTLFQAVSDEWAGREQKVDLVSGVGTYLRVAGFDSLEKVRTMQTMYEQCLSTAGAGSVGCDLGCWLGFSTATMASLGFKRVYGIDIRPAVAREAEAWRARHGVDNVRFRAMRPGVIPLLGASIDWILLNQVLCNALPDTFEDSLREAFRVLRPGGLLVLSDANNPYCPEALERLRRNFRRAEIGDGTAEAPNGPNFHGRANIIRRVAPQLEPGEISTLARETCYMYGPHVEDAVHRYLADRATPGVVFEPEALRPTCIPGDGASNGNLTDPFELSARLERLGFAPPSITCSPLPTPAADNDTLWEQLASSQGFFIFAHKPT